MYSVLIVFIIQIVVNVIGIKAQLDLYDVKREKASDIMNPTVPIWCVFLILGWIMWLFGAVESDIPEQRAVVILFLLFSGVYIIFQVMLFGTVIIYNEQGISIGWFRFHKKYYQYEDIVGSREGDVSEIRDDYSKEIMYIGKQKIFSNIYGEKFEEFKRYAFARYEEKLGTVPSQTVAEHRIEEKYPILDIYHGNVRNIVNEWIAFVLMFLVATVPIGVSIYDIILK